MFRLSYYILLALIFSTINPAFALESRTYESHSIGAKLISAQNWLNSGQKTLSLALHINLKEEWKTYWRSPGEVGLPPIITWDHSHNIAQIDFQWPAPTRFRAFDIENFGYSQMVAFPIRILLDEPNKPVDIQADVRLLVCSNLCIPEQFSLKLRLEHNSLITDNIDSLSAAKIAAAVASVPLIAPTNMSLQTLEQDLAAQRLHVQFYASAGFRTPDVFPEFGQSTYGPPQLTLSNNAKTLSADFPIRLVDKAATHLQFTVVDHHIRATFSADQIAANRINQIPTNTISTPANIWLMLLFAFIGGLILNVMPCVLPVLSIKLTSAFTAQTKSLAKIRVEFLITSAGIISFMWLLAFALYGAKLLGHSIGWGIQFQNPYFLTFMVTALTLFTANVAGLFNISLPASINNSIASIPTTNFINHFLTGCFAALLATPCSAPFLGTAVIFALLGNAFEIIIIFTALGIGLATPYILIATFPRFIRILPKPGSWMRIVKYILTFLLALSTVWAFSLLAAVQSSIFALIIFAANIISIALLYTIRTPYKAILTVGIIILLTLLTPYFYKPIPEGPPGAIAEKKLWQPFDAQQIKPLVAGGQTVFVDVTAQWCLTCKVNKILVLENKAVKAQLQSQNITLMRADWTKADADILAYLTANNRAGIPFNKIYGPAATQGIILPEILTQTSLLEALKHAKALP